MLIDGLRRYIAEKPPDRAWCNPATWLNQERWHDQPAPHAGTVAAPPTDWSLPEHRASCIDYFLRHQGGADAWVECWGDPPTPEEIEEYRKRHGWAAGKAVRRQAVETEPIAVAGGER